MPGDISNAYDYWGATCDATASKCNGDADNIVEWGSANDDRESVRAWQHMSLAEIWPETYGTQSVATSVVAGPDSGFFSESGLGKYFFETQSYGSLFGSGAVITRHNLMLGLGGGVGVSWWNASLTVKEAYVTDLKVDDGIANKGKVYASSGNGFTTECSAYRTVDGGADFNTANLSSDTKYCILMVLLKK